MAEAERQSALETTPAPSPTAPAGPVGLVTPAFGDVTSLVGALAAGPDDWRADVIHGMQRTSGNQAVARLLDPDLVTPQPHAVLARLAGKKKTGIGSDAATGRMAGVAKGVRGDWDKLKTTEARARKLAAGPQAELRNAKVPAFKIVMRNLGGGTAGQFAFSTWTMELDKSVFTGKSPDLNRIAWAAEVVAHEARHCEQWFRMARVHAGRGQTADQISKAMGIPKSIADAAVKLPLKGTTPEANEAQAWDKSVYGSGSKHREKVLTDMPKKEAALTKAQNELDRVRKDPKSKENQIDAAQKKYNAAYKAFNKVYKQYRALPEEADAWIVGGAVGKKVKKK